MRDDEPIGKRIEAKELRAKDRQKLQDVIPVPGPFVVYIEPTNLCNFRCQFCPTSDKELLDRVGRPRGSMSFDLFCKLVDELKAFPTRLKLLSLYKDGEPLLHKRFPDMVRYAKEAAIAERIWTKTNGSLLNPELNRRLVEAGLDMICISVESVSSTGYLRVADARLDYDAFRENLRDLFARRGNCEIYIKIADSGLTKDETEKFYRDFEGCATYLGVEKLMGWSYSSVKDFTMGTNPTTYDGAPLVPKEVCAYPFYVLAINFNGTVSVCGNDWSHSTVVGDASKDSLFEIWHGQTLFEFRKMFLEGKRHCNRACGDCYYLQIVPDNIDDYRWKILERLEESRRGKNQ